MLYIKIKIPRELINPKVKPIRKAAVYIINSIISWAVLLLTQEIYLSSNFASYSTISNNVTFLGFLDLLLKVLCIIFNTSIAIHINLQFAIKLNVLTYITHCVPSIAVGLCSHYWYLAYPFCREVFLPNLLPALLELNVLLIMTS